MAARMCLEMGMLVAVVFRVTQQKIESTQMLRCRLKLKQQMSMSIQPILFWGDY